MENTENNQENTIARAPKMDQAQIAGAIIVAGLIIAGAILLKGNQPSPQQGGAPGPKDFATIKIRPITNDDHIIGSSKSKIVVVEYSDTECPFCKIFHQTMQRVTTERKDIAWVYRHYPLPRHVKAMREAEATECAWEQGGNTAFWKYINRIFEITPSNDGLDEKELSNIAEYIGLNSSSFYTCLESGKYRDKIDSDIKEGMGTGLQGTPYSLILVNGKVVDEIGGAQPYEGIIERLNKIK